MQLLLLPGLCDDGALWAHQVQHLADVSEPEIVEISGFASISAMAEAALALARPRFALAGFSLGGYVALEVVRRRPERVAGLALLCTSARSDTPEQTARRTALVAAARSDFDRVVRDEFIAVLDPSHARDPKLVAGIESMVNRQGPEVLARQQGAIMARRDQRDALARIGCPTLVLVGGADPVTPPERAREIALAIADSRLVVVENCGHYAPLEEPAAVTAALREWVTGLGA
jgi:pimeloyl-ACP methyl ester carboxylesterase